MYNCLKLIHVCFWTTFLIPASLKDEVFGLWFQSRTPFVVEFINEEVSLYWFPIPTKNTLKVPVTQNCQNKHVIFFRNNFCLLFGDLSNSFCIQVTTNINLYDTLPDLTYWVSSKRSALTLNPSWVNRDLRHSESILVPTLFSKPVWKFSMSKISICPRGSFLIG